MRQDMLPYVVPLLGLAILAFFSGLYILDINLYTRILTIIGIIPYKYPFIDWEYIGAGVKCWREGVNVYITNPCDVLNRTHAYSPLLLRMIIVPAGKFWTAPVGIVLGAMFLMSQFWVIRPTDRPELIFFIFAIMSPMVVFAVERANVDVILFMMFVAAGVLGTGTLPRRIISYSLIVVAALLKFYPLVVLLIALRERPRVFLAIAAVTCVICAGFVYEFRTELIAMSGNIPRGSYASDLFGAVNLPNGVPYYAALTNPALRHLRWFGYASTAIMLVLIIFAAVRSIRIFNNSDLTAAFLKLPQRDMLFLVIGAAVIAGCFFVGQSIAYRGIHLIFVVAGLLALRRCAADPATRALLTQETAIVVFLMWDGFFRYALNHEPGTGGPGFAVFWLLRELLWWRLAALLIAIIAVFGVHSEVYRNIKRTSGHRKLLLRSS